MTMKTIKIRQRSDADGRLRLNVPVAQPGQTYQVLVMFQPEQVEAEPPVEEEKDELGWPKGFFEQTAGSWQGDFPEPEYGEDVPRLSFD